MPRGLTDQFTRPGVQFSDHNCHHVTQCDTVCTRLSTGQNGVGRERRQTARTGANRGSRAGLPLSALALALSGLLSAFHFLLSAFPLSWSLSP
jgi:hypothetical protein